MIFGKDNHKKQLFDKRNCLPSHKYLKSPVTNHETWPHYFSLMSCHTWQKYDTNNKNKKRFVSSGPISSFPSVPRQKTCFTGYTVAAPQGEGKKKKTQVQRSCRLANWNKVLRHSQNIQFYTCFISELSWWNETATRFVLPAVRRQKVKQRSRKKRLVAGCVSNPLSRSQIKIPQVSRNAPPHQPSFVLIYSVCSYATLKTKS